MDAMPRSQSQAVFFAGSSHPSLAAEIAQKLQVPFGRMSFSQFPDGETVIQILENVQGCDTFVLQSIALDPSVYFIELLLIIDALKRASAKSIVAVISYFGYCRQDRKDKPRVSIAAKLVANLLVRAGATRIITVDLHDGQLQGFFDVPLDHLPGYVPLVKWIKEKQISNCVVVAPDIGSVKIARAFAHHLTAGFAALYKHPVKIAGESHLTLIGDVKGKEVLLADDMCSTGATLASAAKACQEKGAVRILSVVTHGLCVDGAAERLQACPLEALWMTNTIPYSDRLMGTHKIESVSIAPLLAHAIGCIIEGHPISFF
jgi:ribose-phosphate pyrophosphokinase